MKRTLLLALNVVLLMMAIAPSIAAATPFGIGGDATETAVVEKLTDSQNIDTQLSSGSTNPDALWLWDILVSNYGKKVISGHDIDDNEKNYFRERAYFKDTIGTMPALLNFEMYDYDQAAVNNGVVSNTVDRAIAWSKVDGGIVGFHWHWHIDPQYTQANKQWWQTTYNSDMDQERFGQAFTDAMTNKSGDLYDYIIKDIDLIAAQLQKLKDSNTPVLWRPLHEASGTWFWWGAYGADNYKALWRLMYDRLTNVHHLDNLIWVWCSEGADWFPGADVVDIASTDVGADDYVHKSYVDRYNRFITDDFQTLGLTKMKMLALSETGPIPGIDEMEADGAMWSYWATWVGAPFGTGTSVDKMKSTLNDQRVITLEDLPPQPNLRPDIQAIPAPPMAPNQDPPPPAPENYEEWIWWTGSERTLGKDPGQWRLGIGENNTPWNSHLGPFYLPNAIKPGYVINITFKYDSEQGDPLHNQITDIYRI
ncbi:glycosyl hydrolase [Paenibacillus sp. YAF4_2]|uniref:glycosyl hydrolase n=1 Tax=Paenibacillus sp. YAF4_2 TaxID=3233085 RepID=UPI003F9928A8